MCSYVFYLDNENETCEHVFKLVSSQSDDIHMECIKCLKKESIPDLLTNRKGS